MSHSCITCTSSRTIAHGPRAGSLWCVMKSRNVNPDSACPVYPEAHIQACKQHGADSSQRVLVKSAAESQIETNFQKTGDVQARVLKSISHAQYSDAA